MLALGPLQNGRGAITMHTNLLRYPGCKWSKHIILSRQSSLRSYLPQTDLFNQETFLQYIEQFPVVFLKPSLGGGGQGVFKITAHDNGFLLHTLNYKRFYKNKKQLFLVLKQRCSKRKYLIQQGLDLIAINQRPIDFRILLLKPQNTWELMGVMGKCAAKNRFVTNHARGGKSIRLNNALQRGLGYPEKKCEEMENKLAALGLNIAHSLNETYHNITELGLDVAIDNEEKIWLLEANTKPQFKLFKDHEDRTLFNKIYKYTKQLRSSS
jgi:glutathione synthase/RimK-type ligase-like ATP-grasp enzyme